MHFYRPQRSWGKVMFLQVSVILLTGGAGGYLTPPQSTPPSPLEQTPPRSRHPPEQTASPGADPPEHAVRYGQRAGGTHPTGMQSCFCYCCRRRPLRMNRSATTSLLLPSQCERAFTCDWSAKKITLLVNENF